MEKQIFQTEFGDQKIKVEIRDLAEQANADVLVRCGDTLVLVTAVMSKEEKGKLGFFPLTVDYEERYYAAGKIKGPRYIKREGRPSDEAVCNARLIDRAIRPLFPKGLNREVQVVVTVLSWDGKNDPDILSLIASSVALSISDIPWSGPIGAVRVGQVNDKFLLNPTYEERGESPIDLILTGGKEGKEVLINMIEGSFEEIEEDLILKSLKSASDYLKKIVDFQDEIIKKIGEEKISIPAIDPDLGLEKELSDFLGNKLEKSIFQEKKSERMEDVNKIKRDLSQFIEEKYSDQNKIKYALDFFEKEVEKIIRQNVIQKDKRPDGRKPDEIREIKIEVGLLPRTHGSALFCRGQTKALSILTLGAPGDQQLLEGMEIFGKKRFMHHYNFPPYSVGEIRPMRGPSRRDIGHGMLAERALLPLIPGFDEFPYTMRVVSEILSSNGSTSMASVSSSSLALMDAGVKIKRPAAGIALGLMTGKDGRYKILTDIQGPEDFHGEMDFKVAGTQKGVTAMQMDVKIKGITEKIFKEALEQAKKARLQILEKIVKVLPQPRSELPSFAPRILTLQINPDKIREVVGPGGKIINEIIADTGASIDIQQTGLIFITADSEEPAKKAVARIKNITREVKIGEIFQGKVKKIVNFGAFVEVLPGQEGLIHISQLKPWRVRNITDLIKVGDVLPVQVIGVDEQGKISLSLKSDAFKKAK
ncbi:MAG: polyribonucleotide nucleotidyltransferase [Candidatus Nealsonbacteria bacterium RBG_13_36_15]|uniref:Polyribonucleotide nucleotidyltransferase n=1 Tax=Candidatus Nealsonbacteria bacterium RBG_13_36_15 TaxID=1801660 RepID=A0A1G2DWZ0_9BACT|nr:MAG: polyribonucleotide nucleotidyltransferase [Candidatus Nealsonbacteria bacterium RBG_13_36_15]